jgi:hypothetical protein
LGSRHLSESRRRALSVTRSKLTKTSPGPGLGLLIALDATLGVYAVTHRSATASTQQQTSDVAARFEYAFRDGAIDVYALGPAIGSSTRSCSSSFCRFVELR